MIPYVVAAVAAAPLPPIPITQRTLPNGLRVVLSEDHRTPTVAIDVAYGVGGKDDPAGKSGFAHLFEHLMFKGTANAKPESFDRMTEDVGGENNAYTADDITDYYEVVPANHLERLLWAEADRLANLNVDQANFTTERDVVIGEYDQRILAAPYGRLSESGRLAYQVHPYKNGVIGSPEQLRAASLADVIGFHATYYRPDNATLVLVGDFDAARANAWIDRYFGAIKRPDGVIPRVTAVEPAQTAARTIDVSAANAPLPAILAAWHIPADASADAKALDLVATLLSNGPSSRFRQHLVDAGVAVAAFARADARQQPGLFTAQVIARAGKSLDDVTAALDAQIATLRDQNVSAAELGKAKTQLTAARARSRETNAGIAAALASAAVIDGDANAVNAEAAAYDAVTPADIARVVRTYLTPTGRTLIRYTSGAAAGSSK